MNDVLYNFISPVTGRLPLIENYIFIGGKDGFSIMSPKLIDIELDIININHNLDDIEVEISNINYNLEDLSATAFILGAPNPRLPLSQDLSSLDNGFMFNTAGTISTTNDLPLASLLYKNIWIGDSNNTPQPNPTISIGNLPNLGTTSINVPNPLNPGAPITISGGKIWQGTDSNRPEESNSLLEVEGDIALINFRFFSANFILGSGNVALQTLMPGSQFLTNLTANSWLKTNSLGNGAIVAATIPQNELLMGGANNVPEARLTIDLQNLPQLTNGKIWQGDNINRPIEIDPNFATNDATFIIQTPNAALLEAQVLEELGTGMAKIVVGGAIAIAIPDEDYATVATLEELANQAAASAEEAAVSAEESAASAAESSASAAESTAAAAESTAAAAESTAAAAEATAAAAEATASAAAASVSAVLATAEALSASGSASRASNSASSASSSASDASDSADNASSSATAAQNYLNTLLAIGLNGLPCTADVSFQGFKLVNLGTPIVATDGATKGYVDTAIGNVPLASLTLQGDVSGSGPLNVPVITTLTKTLNEITNAGNINIANFLLNNVLDPLSPQDGATKNYVDTKTWLTSQITNFNSAVIAFNLNQFAAPTASVDFNNNKLINVLTPTLTTDGANKEYVDNAISGLPYSTLTLQGAITGSGPLNLPVITTLNTTLNEITNAGNVNIGNYNLNNVLDPLNPQDGATKNYVDNATIAPSQIINYPSSSSLFLNGAGAWTAPSFSNLITTSSSSYEITINNTNPNSTDTGLLIKNNGFNAVNFGFNNSTKEAYVWAYGSNALLKFGTNATTRMRLLNNGTLDLLTNTITGLANPVNPTDGVNKQYVDSIITPSQLISLSGAISGSGQTGTVVNTILSSLIGLTTNQVFNFTGSPTSFNYDLTIPNSTNQTVKLRLNRANTGNGAGYEFQFYSPSNGVDTFTFGYNSGSVFGNIYSIANNAPVINYIYSLNVNDSGSYQPYNGSYGYLNSNGSTGQATGQNSYSINCTNRIKASEFNAVSSKKIKTILGSGEEIEHTAIELFKKIPLFKYKYKDTIKEGDADHYGVIAEELAEVIPAFVNMQDEGWIPNIYKNCIAEKGLDNSYKLYFNEKLENIEGSKLKLIFQDKEGEKNVEVMITEITADSLSIICSEKLPRDIFAYGTYGNCPTVSKQKVFELGLVALRNLITRVELLEKRSTEKVVC